MQIGRAATLGKSPQRRPEIDRDGRHEGHGERDAGERERAPEEGDDEPEPRRSRDGGGRGRLGFDAGALRTLRILRAIRTRNHSITTSGAPASTNAPSATRTSRTVPSRPARSSFSIFIASITATPCRAVTC